MAYKGDGMSTPIIYCRVLKAVGSPEEMESLKKDLKYNLKKGVFSIWPCEHDPQCRALTEEEMTKMESVVTEIQNQILEEWGKK